MSEIRKRPQVIRDLIDIATYIAENNLENSDRFLFAAAVGWVERINMFEKTIDFSEELNPTPSPLLLAFVGFRSVNPTTINVEYRAKIMQFGGTTHDQYKYSS